ncbi:MAG: alpha/beta fold hydrolase [Chloroflexota bacterium]
MPVIDLPTGAHLDYVDTGGAGRVILLIHGLLGTGHREFPELVDWLRPHARVIAPTLRGYGESMPKPREFPPDFYQRDADDMLALLDALDIDRAHLMGYSDGGETALCAAATAPDRFLSVVVWGAMGYFGPLVRPGAQRMFPATWITPEEIALHHIVHPDTFILGWIKAVHRMVDTGGDICLSRADRITPPLLMLLGEQDRLNPAEYAQQVVDKTPAGRLVLLPCGHAVHREVWPQFQQVVGTFLRDAGLAIPISG